MVKFISKLGGLFGKGSEKPAKRPGKRDPKPKKAKKVSAVRPKGAAKGKKAAKPVRAVAAKPARVTKPVKAAIKKPARPPVVLAKPGREPLKSLVLFTMPNCPDCDEARKLVSIMRRVVRNVAIREVDLSTKEGELEGLLSGVVKAPAFVINGRPVFRGVLPSREQLARVINEGASP